MSKCINVYTHTSTHARAHTRARTHTQDVSSRSKSITCNFCDVCQMHECVHAKQNAKKILPRHVRAGALSRAHIYTNHSTRRHTHKECAPTNKIQYASNMRVCRLCMYMSHLTALLLCFNSLATLPFCLCLSVRLQKNKSSASKKNISTSKRKISASIAFPFAFLCLSVRLQKENNNCVCVCVCVCVRARACVYVSCVHVNICCNCQIVVCGICTHLLYMYTRISL